MKEFASQFKPQEWRWLTADHQFLQHFTVNLHLAEKRASEILHRDLTKKALQESAQRAQTLP
jgi:UTP:GlnB (protein PII) uridylyltransferase